ncbi:Hypothetical predicted protein, partial [Paramuricea clavata]
LDGSGSEQATARKKLETDEMIRDRIVFGTSSEREMKRSKQKSVKFKLDTESQYSIRIVKARKKPQRGSVLYVSHVFKSSLRQITLTSLLRIAKVLPLKCMHQKGIRPCIDMGLTNLQHKPSTRESILEQYKDIFDGIGLFEGKCSIQTDPTVPPVVHPPRRVPVALKGRLKEELERMESLGITKKVTEPTAWVSSLVIIQKPDSGKLRICLDPGDLNVAILRPHYTSRTLEEILPELVNAKFFTKLDAKSG